MKRFLGVVGILGVLVLGGAISVSAEIIYVDIDATGANNGTSWTDAYINLPNAINAAVSDDDIWVSEGTYTATTALFHLILVI